MTAASRLCMWPTGEDLDLDYKFRVGRMARDVSSKFQLKVVRTASSIILDSGPDSHRQCVPPTDQCERNPHPSTT